MDAAQKQIARAAALILLVAIAAFSLRGYIPDVDRVPRRPPTDSSAALIAVCVLLAVSVAILVVAFVASVRGRPARRPQAPMVVERGRLGTTDRKAVLIGAAVLIVGVVVALGFGPLRVGTEAQQTTQSATQEAEREQPESSGSGTPPSPAPAADKNLVPVFTAATVVMVAIVLAGVVVFVRRTVDDPIDAFPVGAEENSSTSESLVRVAERGLAEVSEPGREPRAAIIACYLAMEGGLADAPDAAPLESDTASEVLARAVDQGVLHSDAAAHLVSLFTEARFSTHDMTELQRQSAESLLRHVLADLRGVAWVG